MEPYQSKPKRFILPPTFSYYPNQYSASKTRELTKGKDMYYVYVYSYSD